MSSKCYNCGCGTFECAGWILLQILSYRTWFEVEFQLDIFRVYEEL
jgi:hypothetical protein